MIKATAHTHTKFCDGANTAEEMVQEAIALGFNALGFSSHSYCDLYALGINDENVSEYGAEIIRLKQKYSDKIAIYTGIELDAISKKPDYPFDYVLGSVHYVKAQSGEFYCVDNTKLALKKALRDGFSADSDALCEAYYSALDDMITCVKPDICGHFDLLRCCNGDNDVLDLTTPRYKAAALDVIKKHCQNVIFEINTGGVARGRQPLPYPEPWLLNELSRMGGKIMINSDTHAVNTINAYFKEAEELAKAAGFKTVWALSHDGTGIKEFKL